MLCVVGKFLVSSILMGGDCGLNRHATGGSIPGLLPRLSDAQLNVTQSINNNGHVRHSRARL